MSTTCTPHSWRYSASITKSSRFTTPAAIFVPPMSTPMVSPMNPSVSVEPRYGQPYPRPCRRIPVVRRADGLALYFSRSLIPYPRGAAGSAGAPLRHVGLYVYRVEFLRRYVKLAPTPLETAESLEQLRVLESGFRIAVAVRPSTGQGIDTPEQYEAFVRRWLARRR